MTQAKLPKFLRDFLIYLTTITGKSPRTRKEYEYDLILFFRFIKALEQDIPLTNIHTITIDEITIEDVKELTLEDLYLFMEYCEVQRSNSSATRARKVATLKAFFRYLKGKRRLIEENPAEQLETPKIGKRQPIYLNMVEAKDFIGAIDTHHHSLRNHCMMVLFLNLGIRVSELCSLNLESINDRKLTVIGKGNRERHIYLNDACMTAIESYLTVRKTYKGELPQPLFVSQKGSRFARQTIARIVKQINKSSDSPKDRLTPHKLRHTSATMMYQAGADIRSLQHILGHTSVATTQIYTHIEDEQLQEVLQNNPFNKLT